MWQRRGFLGSILESALHRWLEHYREDGTSGVRSRRGAGAPAVRATVRVRILSPSGRQSAEALHEEVT